MAPRLSGVGIWSANLRYGDPAEAAEAAAELEELGYSALWLPDVGGDVLGSVESLLAATSGVVIATGVLNVWLHEPADVAARRVTWGAAADRFLLGVGASHQSFIDLKGPGTYAKPYTRVREFVEALDAAPTPVPAHDRVLAALGPRMLALAAQQAAGAHPYFVPVEHTAAAREALGAEPLLAPELAVVLDSDPDRARAAARGHMSMYLTLPNYTNNLLRHGFDEDDLRDGGSDRLVDAIVAWGDVAAIEARVRAHRDAGADHVCVQAIRADNEWPRTEWRELAALTQA